MPESHQIDWSGIRAAAIALQSVRDAARRASAHLPPDEQNRFIERVNKRAYRERWIEKAREIQGTSPTHTKPLSMPVQTGPQLLTKMVQSGENPAFLSLIEKREYLASIVRTPVGEVNENSKLAQKVKRRHRTDKDGSSTAEEEIELPGKLKAIELDAKLAGELEPRPDQGGMVSVTLVRLELAGSAS